MNNFEKIQLLQYIDLDFYQYETSIDLQILDKI